MIPIAVDHLHERGRARFHAVVQRQRQDDQRKAKEHVHEQVGRKDDRLFFDVQGELLRRVGDVEIVQIRR